MAADELVALCTYRDETHAEIARNALENEGIWSAIEGEHQGGLPGVMNARLMVRAADAERARRFIEQHEAGRISEEE